MLEILPQLLFTGLGIGAIYALASLGFVLLIRAANVVNFAQGQFSMLGAYILLVLLVGVGLPYWVAFLLAIVLMAGFGVVFAGAVYWPLRNRGQLTVIISTIGASILLPNAVLFSGAYLLGPGFTVGVNTMVSPTVVSIGALPMFPLLAALPDDGATAAWTPWLMGLPPVVAALAAARAQRRNPTVRWEEGALRGCTGGRRSSMPRSRAMG